MMLRSPRPAVALLALAAAFTGAPASARELSVQAGTMDVIGSSETSYAWQISYMAPFARHVAWSVSWLNEGHPKGHHRDGFTPRLWVEDDVWDDRFSIAIGAGLYRYFDTVPAGGGDSKNVNEWGGLVSFSAAWRATRRAVVRLTVNRTITGRDIQTHDYLLGVGWRLDRSRPPLVPGPGDPDVVVRRTVDRELMLFAGKSIVNTFSSPSARAWGVEYRHGIGSHIDWTLSWLDEGRTDDVNRAGVATQLWLENAFSSERFVLGVGAGPYVYADDAKERIEPGSSRYGIAGLVTLSTAWRFGRGWFARLNWNRVASFYDRDADVIALGVGVTRKRLP